jgi:general secretion pathway protein A
MYSSYFKFTGKPFQLSPNPRFYFSSSGHEKAMAYLQYGLYQGEGFIVITGDIGTGKTTLIGYLLDQLDRAKYITAKVVSTQLEADDMLRTVAAAFGIETVSQDKASLLGAFERFLLDHQRNGRRALVLIDEAQNLPVRSLEELRMLSNFQVNDVAPVQFCLLGQPQFRQMIASDELTQLSQRVIASYHLGPLNPDETRGYIEHRLRLVNWESDPRITDEAYARLYDHSAGVPRRLNLLCDRLLLGAMLEEQHEIGGSMVDVVAGEMSAESAGVVVDLTSSLRGPGSAQRKAAEDANGFDHRLTSLERLVQVHDEAIRRALELVSTYLDQKDALPAAEAHPRGKAGGGGERTK